CHAGHAACACRSRAGRLASCSASVTLLAQMPETAAQRAFSPARTTSVACWMAAVGFALLWLELINQLRPEWWLNPQYNYGVIVPALVIYLVFKRWRNRPAPDAPMRRGLAILLVVVSAALFLPIRL